jgi:hypothetical protein
MTKKSDRKRHSGGGSKKHVFGGQKRRFGGSKKRGDRKISEKKLVKIYVLREKNLGGKILGGINFWSADLSH